MVKFGKLWGDADFASLSPNSKLLYCYLVSQPNITTLGVVSLFKDKILFDLSIKDFDKSYRALLKKGYIRGYEDSNVIHAVVVDHWKSLPKSKTNIRKALDEGKSASPKLLKIFREVFKKGDFESNTSFKTPTPSEVSDYALSLGYLVNGKEFCEYYGSNDWYDKNNKLVRNWKQKLEKVWCRDKNKLEKAEGAPKGFEYFYVELESGERIFPTSWKDGLPQHGNFVYAQYLINGFNEKNRS